MQQTPFQAGGTGSLWTSPNGISGISDVALDGTLPPGTIGPMVGTYADANVLEHGFSYDPNDAFFSQVDCSAGGTELWGINNAGLAVGAFFDSAGSHAFTYDTNSGGGCSPLCSGCLALGINDAGWIVGSQGAHDQSGFVYKNQQFIPLQLGVETLITGVNVQGVITGYYSPDTYNFYGFVADASQGAITNLVSFACPAGWTFTVTGGINNNGQVVGYANGLGVGFWLNGGLCSALDFSGDSGWTQSLNDDAQIVGETFDTKYGFVLLPQH
jgi:hypothetical protein